MAELKTVVQALQYNVRDILNICWKNINVQVLATR